MTTGNIIDREIIRKAAEFERIWKDAWDGIENRIKAGAATILGAMQKYAASLGFGSQTAMGSALDYLKELRTKEGPSWLGDKLIGNLENAIATGEKGAIEAGKKLITELTARQTAKTLEAGISGAPKEFGGLVAVGGRQPSSADAYTKRVEKPAKAPSSGSSGKSEADQRYDQEERYIEALQRTGRILDAEISTIGLSNAERAKAIELARIGNVTDADHLKTITAEVEANERRRETLARMKLEIKSVNDAAQFAGNQLLDAFDTLLDGGKIEDALNNITKALAKAAIQAALLGQGPLANLFGGASTTGGPGGLIGSIIGSLGFGGARASGGPVQSGRAYLVGESGPELVRFGRNGSVMPNGVLGRGGGGGMGAPPEINIINNGGGQVETQQRQGASGQSITDIIIGAVTQDVAKNGPLAQVLQGRYALNRSGGRR